MKLIPAVLIFFLIVSSHVAAADAKRPNILFILVDDQSPYDLKCYNPQSPLEAPNIDRLSREGMVFDGAYHMGSFVGAVCTPSRHMIMSGRTVWHLPVSPGPMSTEPRAAHSPRRLQPRRLCNDADLQARQQLRAGEQTVHVVKRDE